ncbi:hypothetical protein [Phormidium sp. CCY1219]|uniref:hypothetical protein n=1 Tax=Phormidium sp. CCY1219 TaxID=2886104 RepID=UPI002D1F0C1E|nr:hypothetical protein [Phormidium sp. CCY1219]MEB3827964.1 hypothetical protein [Phormidium sp. CCY1219]
MTQPIFRRNGESGRSRDSMPEPMPLSYRGVYHCPVCRYGKISELPMMDAFGCQFCNHIFSADIENNSVKLADSSLPLTWYWNGRRWQGAHRAGVELGWPIWIAAIAIVALPPTVVGLAAYIFPPVPGSSLSWLPQFWTVSAFFAHLTIVIWLLVEYYQFPLLVFVRAWRRRLGRQAS